MAPKIIEALTEQLRLNQKIRIEVLLNPAATPTQIDKVNNGLSKARDALTDAIIDDLQDGKKKIDALTAKINSNTQKIKNELKGLKRTVELVKLSAEVTKLAVQAMGIVA